MVGAEWLSGGVGTVIGLVGGAFVRPYLETTYQRLNTKVEANIAGVDIHGRTYLGASVIPHLDDPLDPLDAMFVNEMGYGLYRARVSVHNVKGKDIEKLSLTVGFPNTLWYSERFSGSDRWDLPPLQISVSKVGDEGSLIVVSGSLATSLAVADEAHVAQIAFLGPQTGEFTFHWRVSANGMAHPSKGFGKQVITLATLATLGDIVKANARKDLDLP